MYFKFRLYFPIFNYHGLLFSHTHNKWVGCYLNILKISPYIGLNILMKAKILIISLLLALGLVGVNFWLWQDVVPATLDSNAAENNSETVSVGLDFKESYTVDKLNNQVSVRQLRETVFSTQDPTGNKDIVSFSEAQINSEIDQLTQEIESLKKSIQ